jgi:RNA polymerase sigma-70 factor, ECF subfamily
MRSCNSAISAFASVVTIAKLRRTVPSGQRKPSSRCQRNTKVVGRLLIEHSGLAGIVSDHASVRDNLHGLLPRLWRFCHVLTGDRSAADDLAQSTCVRALERASQFQPGSRLDHWVFRIAQSIWFNQRRAEKIRRGLGTVPAEEAGLASPCDAESNIFFAQVLSSVMGLPEAQRVTVLLVYVEGLSYQEAAVILEIPIGTVMSRLAGARSRLARLRDGGGTAVAGKRA